MVLKKLKDGYFEVDVDDAERRRRYEIDRSEVRKLLAQLENRAAAVEIEATLKEHSVGPRKRRIRARAPPGDEE